VEEVNAGIAILKACGLRKNGVRFISCPTCGRTEIDLISLADEVEEKLKDISKDITDAVMGCVVNGPGEAREADFGIAGGVGKGILFKKGEVLGTYPYSELSSRLMDLINGTED
jgi:(E)-4-hydroxy-3-methylbut-2-enyl-diphosphate synthase